MTSTKARSKHASAKHAPVILALESSTSACSVALLLNAGLNQSKSELNKQPNGQINHEIDQIYAEGINLHSTEMLRMVEQLLQRNNVKLNQLDAIACGVGPGGFTGLRIGVGIAQGLAYSQQLNVVAVSSLAALAQAALQATPLTNSATVYAGIDARMSEFYWSAYQLEAIEVEGAAAQLKQIGDYQLTQPSEFPAIATINKHSIFIGNAWQEYAEPLISAGHKEITQQAIYALPQAKYIAVVAEQLFLKGEVLNAQDLAPLYVRNNVAKKSTKNVLKV